MSVEQRKKLLLSKYQDCIACNKRCRGVFNDRRTGDIPRGFLFGSLEIKVLLVAKNPGHVLSDEKEFYKTRVDDSSRIPLDDVIDKTRQFFQKGENILTDPDNTKRLKRADPRTFHHNILRYMTRFFCEGRPQDVFNHVAFTNLVKCSTEHEQGKLSKEMVDNCYETIFETELKMFNPKVVIAFGREVERFLKKIRKLHGFSWSIVYMRHPSYYYKKEKEDGILTKILENIRHGLDITKDTTARSLEGGNRR